MSRFLCFISLLLLISCGSSKSNPVAPTDPNAGMYGTWNGTLSIWVNGALQQGTNVVVLGKGSVAYYEASGQLPATLTTMSDPNISFWVSVGGVPVTFSGIRSQNVINGSFLVQGLSGSATGSWAATRAPAARLATGHGLQDLVR